MREPVRATGHANVSATHESTFEVTTDDYLTPAGDCILGIEADRAPADFDPAFIDACQASETRIEATLAVGAVSMSVIGRGHEALTFASDRSLVGRTSDYVDDRTVMVQANAAAADLPRDLVDQLASGEPLRLELQVDD
ncbi:MAG: DUF371 domain-containing protein [Halobacteriales archaeon]